MRVLLAIGASLVLISGCAAGITERAPEATPHRNLGPGEQWVPVAPVRDVGGVPLLCGGTGWVGGHLLTGSASDPRLVWMMAGGRQELEWPVGYSARFTPELELLDEDGIVVGHEGTELDGGCEMAPGVWDAHLPCLNGDQPRRPQPSLPDCD